MILASRSVEVEPAVILSSLCSLGLVHSCPRVTLLLPGETEAGSAGAQPTKG